MFSTKFIMFQIATLMATVTCKPMLHQLIDFGGAGALGPLSEEYQPRQLVTRAVHAHPYSLGLNQYAAVQPQLAYSHEYHRAASPKMYGSYEEEEHYEPKPFHYSFENVDEYGTMMSREESGDGKGTVTGHYSYRDAQGMARIVRYLADHNGFRAEIQTNEPGTETSNPADAAIISSNPPVHKA